MRRTCSTALLAGVVVLVGPPTARSQAVKLDDRPREKVCVGYLYGQPRAVNFSLYTHLCHAFLTAEREGTLIPNRNIPDPKLTSDAHSAGVKVLVSLGGWGWDEAFARIVADPKAEDHYVANVLGVVDAGDYDGVDLDWEYPDKADEVAGFERLARRLRAGVDAIGARKGNRAMLVTMAASSNPGTLRWLDRDFLMETMDWINVMTYDYAGDWSSFAGHNAPLHRSTKAPKSESNAIDRTMTYLMDVRKIPADRLALGIPLYGRGFSVAEPYLATQGAPRFKAIDGGYAGILKLMDEGWTRRWDDEIQAPWLISPDRKSLIGFDDPQSVRIKADWARQHELRGVFFWQVDQDRLADGSNPLQQAARQALFSPVMPGTAR